MVSRSFGAGLGVMGMGNEDWQEDVEATWMIILGCGTTAGLFSVLKDFMRAICDYLATGSLL